MKKRPCGLFLFPAEFSGNIFQQYSDRETYCSPDCCVQSSVCNFISVCLQYDHQDRSANRSGPGIAAEVVVHFLFFCCLILQNISPVYLQSCWPFEPGRFRLLAPGTGMVSCFAIQQVPVFCCLNSLVTHYNRLPP